MSGDWPKVTWPRSLNALPSYLSESYALPLLQAEVIALVGVLAHLSETTPQELTERVGFEVGIDHVRELADHGVVTYDINGNIYPTPVRDPDFAVRAGPPRTSKRIVADYDAGYRDRYRTDSGWGSDRVNA